MNFKELFQKPKETKPKPTAAPTDVVGVELGSGSPNGCPAVRLAHRKGEWIVEVLGFVPPPTVELPASWKDLDLQPTWSLPSALCARFAALAVNSSDLVVRQTTADSLAEGGASVKAGEVVARNGLRFTTMPLGEEPFVLESALPEYQALWLARLLPEGRRPTACSLQAAPTAMLAALAEQPAFKAAEGNAAALFVTGNSVYFAGFREGVLQLFREFSGVGGLAKIREALQVNLGLDPKMADDVLEDTLIDPTPVLGPIVRPVLRQVELSLDYLKNRLGVQISTVFLMGLPTGARHWQQLAKSTLHLEFLTPSPFEGLTIPERLARVAEPMLARPQVFLSALGAARAAMEERP